MGKRNILLWAVFIVILLVGMALTYSLFQDSARQQQALRQTVTSEGRAKQPDAGKVALTAAHDTPSNLSQPAFPPIEWQEAPTCANRPQPVQELAKTVLAPTGQAETGDLRRARLLSPALASLDPAGMNGLLADQTTDANRQILLGLALNIATGRLNRETGLAFPDLPEIKTAGDLLNQLEAGLKGQSAAPAMLQAGQQLLSGQGLARPVCAHLLITSGNAQPADIQWSAGGIQAQAMAGTSALQRTQTGPVIDTVTVSPDGRWGAFTSLSTDSGGPLLIANLKSGDWTNLIEKMNASRPANMAALPADGYWDLIGWMPDSQRVVLGISDISALYITDIYTGKFDMLTFNGAGMGGAQFAGLAGDGSRLAYVEMSATGDGMALTLYQIDSRETKTLLELPYSQGTILYPRLSPDGAQVAFVTQKGTPETGFAYALQRYDLQSASVTVIAEGNLGLSVPTWSPDGKFLAFTRKNTDEPDRYNPDRPLDQPASNIWVAEVATGKLQQMTSINGIARRPAWASDARTLSFITHDGQVGLVSLDQPGQIWRAAGFQTQLQPGTAVQPGQVQAGALLVSAFFIP